jgi:hypothetical protein
MARPPWTTPASSASSSGPSFERVPGKKWQVGSVGPRGTGNKASGRRQMEKPQKSARGFLKAPRSTPRSGRPRFGTPGGVMLVGDVKVRRGSSASLWLICRGRLGATARARLTHQDCKWFSANGTVLRKICNSSIGSGADGGHFSSCRTRSSKCGRVRRYNQP